MPFVTRKSLFALAGLVVLAVVAAGLFVWSGVYNVAADDTHTRPVYAILQALRSESIEHHARNVEVPDLDDPALVVAGAGNYAAMCAGCHLAPGTGDTELSRGLYPTPPRLADRRDIDPKHDFWVIKHGIKASGMPAWGKSMEDRYIWGMVAFLRKLPQMDQARYHAIVERSDGHSHGGGENASPAGASPGATHVHADGKTHLHTEQH